MVQKSNSLKLPKETVVWVKVGKHFIDQNNIRAISRKGKNTVIGLFSGKDIVVDVSYDKVKSLLPQK